MEPPWDRGKKVCSNGPDHMTKMAIMPIYGKNLKKSSSPEPKGQWPWSLVCSIRCSSTNKFVQMMTLGWPWLILRQGQILSHMLLYGKKVKQWIFQKLYLDTLKTQRFTSAVSFTGLTWCCFLFNILYCHRAIWWHKKFSVIAIFLDRKGHLRKNIMTSYRRFEHC